jgi:predicted HTH domain antitoxin
MQVTINIPDFAPFTLNNNMQELKYTIKLNTALMLFKNGKFSIEQASSFAGIDIYTFISECNKNNIPVISYEENELENELEMLRIL